MYPNIRKLKILGIGGSLREHSFSYLALEHAVGIVREMGCTAEIFDLRLVELPFCNGDKKDPCSSHPAVGELRRLVREAHGLILATPEYHGSLSGVLKNVLDLLDFEHLEGKVVGGISTLGGRHNSNALNDLRRIIRWCHGWMIPEQIAISQVRSAFASGQLQDPELLARFEGFARSLVQSALRLNDYFLPVNDSPACFSSGHALQG